MNYKKQEELLGSFLDSLDFEQMPLYRELAECLAELGYRPQKTGSSLSFKHTSHSKQIAKMGVRASKKTGEVPFFALRFSACRSYSPRFADIVHGYIAKYPTRLAMCTDGNCTCCGGEPSSHVYSDGAAKPHCGAYAIEIPDITADDIDEIKRLVKEEHAYLILHEVNRE